MMHSKSTLHYLLSFFIVLANVEINFGYYKKYDEVLKEIDCYRNRHGIVCTDESKIEEQVARLKEFHSLIPISSLAFSNRRHFSYEIASDFLKDLKVWDLVFFNSTVTRFTNEIGGPAFVGQENSLEELRIYDCSMDEKYKDLFSLSHLRKLRKFLLTGTDIQSFGNGYFRDSPESSVKYVEIYENQITEIGDSAFASLKMLAQIYLNKNRIKMLKRSMFPNPATHLENIFVEDNPLEVLEKDLFENMPKLEYLNLGRTGVKVIDEAMFKPIWSQLSFCIFDAASCEEDDIRWMVNRKEPEILFVKCKDKDEDLGKLLEEMRKEVN